MTNDGQQSNCTQEIDFCKSLCNIDEIAKFLGVGDEKVRELVKQGMPCYRFGYRTLRFQVEQVQKWLDNNLSSQPVAMTGNGEVGNSSATHQPTSQPQVAGDSPPPATPAEDAA